MKKIYRIGLLFLLAFLAACSTSSTNTPNETVLPKQRFDPYPEEFQILGLTNEFRAQARTCGGQQFAAAPALTWVEAIGDTAWFHSSDMNNANTESHVGASTVDRLKARGFDPGTIAENRKKTNLPPSPNEVFNIWKADATACANLMNPAFTVMGAGMFGFYEGGTSAYWTQILTTPKGNAPAAALAVNPTAVTVTVGGTAVPITATLTGATGAINWSLNGGRGSLSSTTGTNISYTPPTNGAAGNATLTATSGALTASVAITINADASVITVSPAQATAQVGGAPITFTATTNSAQPIGWGLVGAGSISTPNGASTVYTPPATGGASNATLCAVAGGASQCISINVVAAVLIAVSPNAATVQVGGAPVTFITTVSAGSDPNTITWNLNGAGSLSTTTGGSTTYTPPATGGPGTATLTATLGATNSQATITITAPPPPPSLSITPPNATVKVGDPALTFTAVRTNTTDPVSWNITGLFGSWSSAGSAFTYNPPATGNAGTATITATAGNLTATATVTVNANPAAATLTVSPTTATSTINGSDVALFANLNGATDPISWTVTGPGDVYNKTGAFTWYMAPVSGTGGTVTVTAKAGNLTSSATITLNPANQTFDQQFLALINQFRSQPQTCFNGDVQETLPAATPLVYNAQLNTAARLHAEDMATNNYFSHTGLNGSSFSQRATAAGYTGSPQGENIAQGQDTAQGAFDSWRNSHAGHCQAMMSSKGDEMGLGYAINGNSSGKHYWVYLIGKK